MWGKDSLPSFPHTPILARAVWAPWVTFLGLSSVAFVFTLLSYEKNPHLTNFHIDKGSATMYHISSAGTGVCDFL